MSSRRKVSISAKNTSGRTKKKRKLNNAPPRNKTGVTKTRSKARIIQGLSPYNYFYQNVRKAVEKCGKDTINFLKVIRPKAMMGCQCISRRLMPCCQVVVT